MRKMLKIIFDCDNTMGQPFKEVDDGLTLLYLLGCPNIELLAVTTTFGNGRVDQVFTQTRKLLAQVGRADIPVFKGANQRNAPPTDAARFLAEIVAEHPGEISLLATGPLGNLHNAAGLDPQFFNNLKQIVCMGGYLSPLQIGIKEINELNLSADPQASYQVLNAPCPVTLMNAHVCLQASLQRKEITRLTFWPWKIRRILYLWLLSFGLFCSVTEFYLWDLLPAVYLSHPALFTAERVNIVSTIKDLENGTLIAEAGNREKSINMPSQIIDEEHFKAVLLEAWKSVVFQ